MNTTTLHTTVIVSLLMVGFFGLNFLTAAGYESAEYKVIEADGRFEIREYPDLMLAATTTKLDAQGRDGSFMKLFGYISGANESGEKIEMTTPVFMGQQKGNSGVEMGFVMPKGVASKGAPKPTGEQVEIRKREGGRFAVIRFSGQLSTKTKESAETKLRAWMKTKGLEADESSIESAGYDPPFTPSFLRRNEVLIRIARTDK